MRRPGFPLEGGVGANGLLQGKVLWEKCGDKCGPHIYFDGLGLISVGRLVPLRTLKRRRLPDEQAKQAEISIPALPRL